MRGDRYACEFKLHMRMLLLPAAAIIIYKISVCVQCWVLDTLLTNNTQGMGCPFGKETESSTHFFHNLAPFVIVSFLVTSHMTNAAVDLRAYCGIKPRNGS